MSQHLNGVRVKQTLGVDNDVVICRPLFMFTPFHLAIALSIRWSTAS